MADSRAAGIFAALRSAARSPERPFLLSVVDEAERARIKKALGAEGPVDAKASLKDALEQLSTQPTEIALLDPDSEQLDVDPIAAAAELSATTEVILLVDGDPKRIGALFGGAIQSLLPRPLPPSDALLRAHVRWLVAGRRSRARGVAIAEVFARHRNELSSLEPALVQALDEVLAGQNAPITVAGDAAEFELDGGKATKVDRDAEVVLVGVGADQDIAERMRASRAIGAGAAFVVCDAQPTAERAGKALYGGARAYLDLSAGAAAMGDVAGRVGTRRRAEVQGRQLIETLARFAVFDSPERGGSAATPSAPPRTRSRADVVIPSGHEVLVVDDEIVVLTVLREALRRGGYRVTTARSAEEAIELLKKQPFDVVLTDKNLTGASGLEVLRFSRTLNPPPAVIVITGYSSYDSAVEALDIGALDYIEKPIKDVELLRQRVRRALNRRDEQLSQNQGQGAVGQGGDAAVRSRVLLVEIEDDKRKLLTDFLARTFDVVSAADGDEALQKLQAGKFDVVLADRNLPGMMGLRVIEQAKKLLPHCASVLYTAYPSYDTVKEAFEVGADAFAVGPSEDVKALKSLEEKVAGALRGKGGIMLG